MSHKATTSYDKWFRLASISISNFRGIESLQFDFPEGAAEILGANGSGKSTVADAVIWLFTGKDSEGRSDYEIKTRGADRAGVVSVSASINSSIGPHTIRRDYTERWTKARGESVEKLAGNTTSFYVDAIPMSKAQFSLFIQQFTDEDLLPLIINPTAFCQLKWTAIRSWLVKLSGEITVDDVIASHPELEEIREELAVHPVEDLKKSLATMRRTLQKDLESYPARLDEVTRTMAEEEDTAALHERIEAAERELRKLTAADTSDTAKALADLQSRIASITSVRDTEREEARTAFELHKRKAIEGAQAAIRQCTGGADQLTFAKVKADETRKKLESLRKQYSEAKAETFPASSTVCPLCKRSYPQEKIEELKSAWAARQASRIEEISENGKRTASDLRRIETEMQSLSEQAEASKRTAETLRKELEHIEAGHFSWADPYAEELESMRKEQDAMMAAMLGNGEQTEKNEQAEHVRQEIAQLRHRATAQIQRQEAQKRIEQLRLEEKGTALEIDRTERLQGLCDSFAAARALMLEENINRRFRFVKWKLFDRQINGAIVDCCEATVGGVMYGTLNTAARISAGLDIVSVLSDCASVSAPCFLDNAESITSIPPFVEQLVMLRVSADHKELEIVEVK